MRRRVKRGAVRKGENSVFIGAWVPTAIASGVDQAIQVLDLDRSKFLRRALEEKITKEQGK